MSKEKTESRYDSIGSWNGVCMKLEIDPKVQPGVEGLSEDDARFAIAAYHGKKITEAYNKVDEEAGEKSIADKYPYFNRGKKGGAGFSFQVSYCDLWLSVTDTAAAARLCGFKTFGASDHAGVAHIEVWKVLVHGK